MDTPRNTSQVAIRIYFGKLGLEVELADIYLALHAHGPQTISSLSRTSKVERTRIYRLIDKLMESNLIELETSYKRGIVKAAPISNLRILINKREAELKNLQDELGLIEQALARNSLSNPGIRIQLFHGPEGIRQMLQNELNASTEILAYADHDLEETTGNVFMNHWTNEFEARKLTCHQLINDDFTTGSKAKNTEYVIVPENLFKLRHICHIYNELVAYYHRQNGDVYGIEVYSGDVADSQRQFFKLLWEQSRDQQRL